MLVFVYNMAFENTLLSNGVRKFLDTNTIFTFSMKYLKKPQFYVTPLNVFLLLKADTEDMDAMMQTLHGVGGQVASSSTAFTEKRPNHEGMKSINAARLSKFLESASRALTTLLEEDSERKYGASGEAQDQKDVVFSEKVKWRILLVLIWFLIVPTSAPAKQKF